MNIVMAKLNITRAPVLSEKSFGRLLRSYEIDSITFSPHFITYSKCQVTSFRITLLLLPRLFAPPPLLELPWEACNFLQGWEGKFFFLRCPNWRIHSSYVYFRTWDFNIGVHSLHFWIRIFLYTIFFGYKVSVKLFKFYQTYTNFDT